MTDIVERLRINSEVRAGSSLADLMEEAAGTITRLRSAAEKAPRFTLDQIQDACNECGLNLEFEQISIELGSPNAL